jgi:hypothetical protein
MLWADTVTGNVKRRNAANSAWDIVGRIVPTVTEDASGNVGIGVTPSYKLHSYIDNGATAGVAYPFVAQATTCKAMSVTIRAWICVSTIHVGNSVVVSTYCISCG